MKKNIKLIYNNVEKGIIGIHLFACLFISGNIFFILLAMIGSLIIMKLCEISVSFIYTIPFITEDDRRRIAEKDPNSYKLNLYKKSVATVYKGNIIKNLIMDCQSYTKYRPNETTGGIFVSWRRKEELPTGA